MNASLFVTGTDTSVGKTLIAGLLLDFLLRQGVDAGYQKWVATGPERPPADLRECLALAGLPLPGPEEVRRMVPFAFALPASPHLAAEQEGGSVDAALLRSSYEEMRRRHALLLVEGVGGILVPLRRDLLLADFLAELRMPALVVARPGLGTINHTLLTLEALRSRKIPVLGVLCTQGGGEESGPLLVADNMRTIAELGRVEVFGLLPYARSREEARELFVPLGRAIFARLFPGRSPLGKEA
jgi:dethiobiotin synthetase